MHLADTRTAILETAAQLYADFGYSAVSMRDVATEVGVTPANLYHHFEGKDELVREAVAHVFAQKTVPIAELVESQGTDADRLSLFVAYFVRLLTEDRVFFRLLVRELVDGDEKRLDDLARSVLERPFRLVSGLAGQGQSEDERLLATVSIISVMLGHALLAPLIPHLPGGRPDHSDASVIAGHISAALRRSFHSNAKDK
ncbi:TetR/AcrR family transcriptional regulator [Ancylobacter sp. VNQ12]|uniref:TetR/AcrR family transcriptional regulator n=1 Tax=Ancylobacter sp. VNQ12 TaxID=3400920 RepID=UPI003C08378C